jgi:probable F420-dependent oxidoreductase
MRIGAVFPQTEIGADPGAIRAYAQAVEAMGFDHILAYDHVLGADTTTRPDWRGPYTSKSMFHEIFVLFGYLAAIAPRVELVAGVLVLPQRQTALVAKQAAEVDVLTGGKTRLGIGVGWNEVEFVGLGESFTNRGKRIEEQMTVLRQMWTEPSVTFQGHYHTIEAAGINPLPVQRPIPIWIGGHADAVLRRVARMADGWFPQRAPGSEARAEVERLRGYLREAGRTEDVVQIEARLSLGNVRDEAGWRSFVDGWKALGATYLTINTMGAGYKTLDEHLAALKRAKEVAAG